jgi:uncharacterized integral membrane protein
VTDETTTDTPAEPSPAETPEKHETLVERLEESRRTFQPGLWLRLVVGGGAIVYLTLFVALNTRKVKVSFVFGETHVSLIWVILLAVALGLVVGTLSSQLHRFRRRKRPNAKR